MDNEFEGAAREIKGRIKDGIGGFTGDAADAAAEAVDDATSHASDIASRTGATLRDAAQTVRKEAAHAGEVVYEAGAKATAVVGDTVKQYPLISLIGMAAIGYLAAFLAHSPSSPLAPPPSRPLPLGRWRR